MRNFLTIVMLGITAALLAWGLFLLFGMDNIPIMRLGAGLLMFGVAVGGTWLLVDNFFEERTIDICYHPMLNSVSATCRGKKGICTIGGTEEVTLSELLRKLSGRGMPGYVEKYTLVRHVVA